MPNPIKLLLPIVFICSVAYSGGVLPLCPVNHIWNNGCVKLCTHPDFNQCGNVFPGLYNPSYCALLRSGKWKSETFECAACQNPQVIGVKAGKCSCQ